MLIDARSLETGTELSFDLCIIGAGAAGITIARECAETSFSVCLLEAGGLGYEERTQALYAGETVGHEYRPPDVSRLRMFGGTTNHWAGNCAPLDSIDFERRPWVPYSGWPFGRDELNPYYRRAQSYCQLGALRYDAGYWQARVPGKPLPLDPGRIVTRITQLSPPTRFGDVYMQDLEAAANVSVYLHANVTELETTTSGERVTAVRAAVLDGPRFALRAKVFVLATGGIENARILQLSNTVHKGGLGNSNGLVGRFFMDHPLVEGAVLHPTAKRDYRIYSPQEAESTSVVGFLQLADTVLREQELRNVRLPLLPVSRYYLSEGVASFHRLRLAIEQGNVPDDFWQHVWDVVTDIDMVLEGFARSSFDTQLFESAADFGGYVFDTMLEPEPDPENRVTLDDAVDALGLQRVRLHWRLGKGERNNLAEVYRVVGSAIGAAGVGRVRLNEHEGDRVFEDLLSFGDHHMGTTRMHADPKHGVVDPELRVHDTTNLYVAGSSVFPTAGHVPPTLTIVALAIRLADHLRRTLETPR